MQCYMTAAGVDALFAAHHAGFEAEFTHIGVGSDYYAPPLDDEGHCTLTALRSEVERVEIAHHERPEPRHLNLGFVLDNDDAGEYQIGEVGVYLADGTLALLYSDPARAFAYKMPGLTYAESVDVVLGAVPVNSITVKVSEATPWQLVRISEAAGIATSLIYLQLRVLEMQAQIDQLTGANA